MDSAEIVIGEVQRKGRAEVRPFLGEGVRQAGEALAPLTQGTVLALDMGCADTSLDWVSIDGGGVRFGQLRGAVPALGFLRLLGVYLH